MRLQLVAVSFTLLLAACAQPSNQEQQSSQAPSPSAAPSAVVSAPAPSTAPPPSRSVQTVVGQPAPSASPVTAGTRSGTLPAASAPPPIVAPSATLAPGIAAALPSVTPTPEQIVMLPANAPPRIVDLRLDKTDVQSGEVVSGTVQTSSNVASVEARIAAYSISVPKIGTGRFALSYRVPALPFFLKKTYDMIVIARNTAGAETTRVVPITIH